jgi:outer membrane protein OmpA-like peptidoglycan-associated protein
VTARGQGFGHPGSVRVDGKPAAAPEWGARRIVFQAPQTPGIGVVRVDCGVKSNEVELTVRANKPPVAGIAASPVKLGSRRFRLDGRGSADADGRIVKWAWTRNGRHFSNKPVTAVALPRGQNTAQVQLTVTDDRRARASARRTLKTGIRILRLPATENFEEGSDNLTDKGRKHLIRFRRGLRRQAQNVQVIRIAGYADFVGTRKNNKKLSRRRAKSVQKVLLTGVNVPRSRVQIQAFGESKAKAKRRNDPQRAKDRRVDVVVVLRSRESSA